MKERERESEKGVELMVPLFRDMVFLCIKKMRLEVRLLFRYVEEGVQGEKTL